MVSALVRFLYAVTVLLLFVVLLFMPVMIGDPNPCISGERKACDVARARDFAALWTYLIAVPILPAIIRNMFDEPTRRRVALLCATPLPLILSQVVGVIRVSLG